MRLGTLFAAVVVTAFVLTEINCITNKEFFDLVKDYAEDLESVDLDDPAIKDDNEDDNVIDLPGNADDELDMEYLLTKLDLTDVMQSLEDSESLDVDHPSLNDVDDDDADEDDNDVPDSGDDELDEDDLIAKMGLADKTQSLENSESLDVDHPSINDVDDDDDDEDDEDDNDVPDSSDDELDEDDLIAKMGLADKTQSLEKTPPKGPTGNLQWGRRRSSRRWSTRRRSSRRWSTRRRSSRSRSSRRRSSRRWSTRRRSSRRRSSRRRSSRRRSSRRSSSRRRSSRRRSSRRRRSRRRRNRRRNPRRGQCSCRGLQCRCCISHTFRAMKFRFSVNVCINIGLATKKDHGLNFTVTANGQRAFHRVISLRQPPPLCIPVPSLGKSVFGCIELYNINLKTKTMCLRAAAAMDMKITRLRFPFNIGCFRIPMLDELSGQDMADLLERMEATVENKETGQIEEVSLADLPALYRQLQVETAQKYMELENENESGETQGLFLEPEEMKEGRNDDSDELVYLQQRDEDV